MHGPMIPWLARRPPLLDSAGAPVLTTAPSTWQIDPDARADPLDTLLDFPTQHSAGNPGAVLITCATRAPQLMLLVQTDG